ncbi:Eco57I restriction-modification methylase [Nitrosospira sp. Nsp11]|uniref:Eco57I restriction-modification methylase domain-containing protein n=1 Tax=Nitrosospira sp. Nsp11 TaxID=1855338 RepID=UPI00092099B9|nr:Eco57I restriction-modification methylase domain-containing protein [Nitrosospira sp. Nsp11]SHM15460.1 Eco57I restriction-modification methylase [Nitrosospira sp. Nsp11]
MRQLIEDLEMHRSALQARLDSQKTSAERNRLGQFATPTQLARDVLTYGLSLLPETMPIRFFDPAIGTGSFYSALRSTSTGRPVKSAQGFEIDPHYGEPARALWQGTPLDIKITDFTRQTAAAADSKKATLLICNPPYVRHHHLNGAEKIRLQSAALETAHIRLSGLSGLYCYFMALAHSWMSEGGVAGWLIPSEFMDVNYGRMLKQYLLRDVTLLHIHRFDPNNVQFDDALVSSAVVWFRKEKPPVDHHVMFSYGGTMRAPTLTSRVSIHDLRCSDKWTKFPKYGPSIEHEGYRLADLFAIKRGLATGSNDFFIVDEAKANSLNLPWRFLRPVLPSTRYIKADEINADSAGVPLLDKRLFLIDCDRPEEEIAREQPVLWAYLQTGVERVAPRYLCRSRRIWYGQERRPAAPIVCTYLGRSDHERRPFRFLLNNSQATATNVYLMLYPQPLLAKQLMLCPGGMRSLWQALNSIERDTLLGNGRVYGGGLHKLEPRELGNVPADSLAALVGLKPKAWQLELIGKTAT